MAQVEKCPNDRMRPPSVSEANRAILVAAENEQVYKLVENEEEDEWIGITFEEHCLLFKDKYEDYLDYWEKAVVILRAPVSRPGTPVNEGPDEF